MKGRGRLLSWKRARRKLRHFAYLVSVRALPRYRPTRQSVRGQSPGLACNCGQDHSSAAIDWSGLQRPLYFTYRYGTEHLAAIQLRCHQVAHLLVQLGAPHEVVCQPIENLSRVRPRDSVIVVGKTAVRPFSIPLLRQFVADGNLVLFDMVDGEVSRLVQDIPHGYVCASMSEQRARSEAGYQTIVSLMSPDQRFPVAPFEGKPFGVAYHGLPKNALHLEELPEVTVIDYAEIPPAPGELPLPTRLDELGSYSHHYSIRQWNPGDGFKPLMKGYVAARLGACIIASAEDLEPLLILGADYPYLSPTSELADVRATLAHARDTYLGPVWEDAVQTMTKLRVLSCPFQTASELVAGISQLLTPHTAVTD